MKKFVAPIVIVIILAIIALFYFFNNSKSTIKKELRDFAVEDTASITRVFMADKANKNITLTRQRNTWLINNEFPARKDLTDVLLKTICRLRVKAPVPKSAHNTIVKGLATNSVKVEIYRESTLLKTFYVGGATPDNLGTYMLLEGSSVPFIMEIPGFFGYLTPRFTTDINDWKDKCVFSYKFTDIATIVCENISAPKQSFKIESPGNNIYNLISLADNKPVGIFDSLSVKEYIANFKLLNFESYAATIPPQRRDSIKKARPIARISVTDRAGKTKDIVMYMRPNLSRLLNNEGKPYEYDPDRMYAFINGYNELVIVQNYVFDPVIKELGYFLKQKKHF